MSILNVVETELANKENDIFFMILIAYLARLIDERMIALLIFTKSCQSMVTPQNTAKTRSLGGGLAFENGWCHLTLPGGDPSLGQVRLAKGQCWTGGGRL